MLSKPALDYLLNEDFSNCKSDECKSVINSAKFKAKTFMNDLPSRNFETRHCDQYMFNVLVCEKLRDLPSIKQVNENGFKKIGSSVTNRSFSDKESIVEGVCLKGEIYIFF